MAGEGLLWVNTLAKEAQPTQTWVQFLEGEKQLNKVILCPSRTATQLCTSTSALPHDYVITAYTVIVKCFYSQRP